MAQIIGTSHTVAFFSLRGEPQPLALVVREISRQGVTGHAYRKDANRGKVFQMIGLRDCDDAADASGLFTYLLGMQGSLVQITDDFGVNYLNVMMLAAEEVSRQKLLRAVGGLSTNKTIWAIWRFEFQLTQ